MPRHHSHRCADADLVSAFVCARCCPTTGVYGQSVSSLISSNVLCSVTN